MTQVTSLRILANDGVTVIEIPVFDGGTSLSAGQYPLLKFEDPVDGTSIVVFSTSGSSDTIEEIKVEHNLYGVLCPLSQLVAPCESYTLIDGFTTVANFTKPPFDDVYGNPHLNYSVDTVLARPLCGESGQNLKHSSTTAGTVFSDDGGQWTMAEGNTLQCFVYFSNSDTNFNITILYFGNLDFGSYYRFFVDFGNNNIRIQKNGSTAPGSSPTTLTSQVTGEWLNLRVSYRADDPALIECDVIRVSDGSSLLTAPLSSTDTAYTSDGVGIYCKSPGASNPIYLNALRYT